MKDIVACQFCNSQHEANVKEGQFFAFICETYGKIRISRRARKELERHPHRLFDMRNYALQCKGTDKVLSITTNISKDGVIELQYIFES